ncbi:hypothetical protein [Micromonospora inositola]|uniref:FAD:protein FMN transferase n=1 Tax=Micromonospora inositola TaxID=47865 RepID=A0A1C5JUN8_9ACTN|nr:hypothetical protein [Micromonospora inositola]SCG74294.1 hypothetical protein GA0070613_5500 [Micromonospora inositola]
MSLNGTFEVRWWWRDRPVRVAVTERTALPAARRAVAGKLAALRTAEAELAGAHRAAGRAVPVGPLLRDLVAVALGAAAANGGAVDPTAVGSRIAAAGPAPDGGWPVVVDGGPVALAGGALVTADPLRADGGGVRDPRTGGAPASPWAAVTVAAPDAARAAMLAVAALVRGPDGPEWLAGQGVPAWPVARPAALPQPATRW